MNEIERVQKELTSIQKNWADLARALGVTDQVVYNWRSRARIPKGHQVKVAVFLRKSVDWLLTGDNIPRQTENYRGEPDQEKNAAIPRLKMYVDTENYHIIYDPLVEKKPQSFRRNWIHEQGWKEKDLICVYAPGDSMLPTISDGANLMINRGETTVLDGKVYAIRFGREIRVKRLYLRPDGGFTVRSDNPGFDPVEVPANQLDHIAIIGRVVWQSGLL